MANSLVQQAVQLKEMVELAKDQSIASKEEALRSLRQQLEKEKMDVSLL